MTHVITLIGAPGASALTHSLASRACDCVPNSGQPIWLADGEACDIPFVPDAPHNFPTLELSMRAALGGVRIDVAIQPVANRRKELLIADMDSTIIQQECIDEIADFAGLKPKIAAITGRAMRGELEFETALRERVGLLNGLDEEVLQQVIDDRIKLTPGASTLVRTMKKGGAFCALVSGGFSFFTSRIAAITGFDIDQANRLEISHGKLTGRVNEPILGQDAKLEALLHYSQVKGIAREKTMAVGDGANDLAMITEAGLGIAFRAKPIVAAQADIRIEHADLTALLYLQGYSKDSFVEA